MRGTADVQRFGNGRRGQKCRFSPSWPLLKRVPLIFNVASKQIRLLSRRGRAAAPGDHQAALFRHPGIVSLAQAEKQRVRLVRSTAGNVTARCAWWNRQQRGKDVVRHERQCSNNERLVFPPAKQHNDSSRQKNITTTGILGTSQFESNQGLSCSGEMRNTSVNF